MSVQTRVFGLELGGVLVVLEGVVLVVLLELEAGVVLEMITGGDDEVLLVEDVALVTGARVMLSC
jgi:hypothetical protein